MRTIKFRAWDKNTKKIKEVGSLHFNDGTLWLGKGLGEANDWADIESTPLMQFTGLKDKNGIEIFEGDILQHDLWGIDEVIWDSQGACFRGNSKKHDITLSNHQLKRSRVIGNIYEYPNLLKSKDYMNHSPECPKYYTGMDIKKNVCTCSEPQAEEKCNCKEMSCYKDCTSRHTHKGFFCEKCEPKVMERLVKEQKAKEKESDKASVRREYRQSESDKLSGSDSSQIKKILAEFEEKWPQKNKKGDLLWPNLEMMRSWLTTTLEKVERESYERGCKDTDQSYGDYAVKMNEALIKCGKETRAEAIREVLQIFLDGGQTDFNKSCITVRKNLN